MVLRRVRCRATIAGIAAGRARPGRVRGSRPRPVRRRRRPSPSAGRRAVLAVSSPRTPGGGRRSHRARIEPSRRVLGVERRCISATRARRGSSAAPPPEPPGPPGPPQGPRPPGPPQGPWPWAIAPGTPRTAAAHPAIDEEEEPDEEEKEEEEPESREAARHDDGGAGRGGARRGTRLVADEAADEGGRAKRRKTRRPREACAVSPSRARDVRASVRWSTGLQGRDVREMCASRGGVVPAAPSPTGSRARRPMGSRAPGAERGSATASAPSPSPASSAVAAG